MVGFAIVAKVPDELFSPSRYQLWRAMNSGIEGKEAEAHCRGCNSELYVWPRTEGLEKEQRFQHQPDSPTNPRSPCIYASDHRSGSLLNIKGERTPDAGKRLREELVSSDLNIRNAFALYARLVTNNFTAKKFVELVKIADIKRIWSLRGMNLDILPFFLVLNEPFKVQLSTKPGRNQLYDITFVLKRRVTTLDPPRSMRARPVLEKRFIADRQANMGNLVRADARNPFPITCEDAIELRNSYKLTRPENIYPETVNKIRTALEKPAPAGK